MISNYLRALRELSEPHARGLILRSVLGAILVFVALFALAAWGLAATEATEIGWLDTVLDLFGGLAALIVAYVLFPGAVAAIAGLFLDRVVAAIEARDYPSLPPAREPPLAEQILSALRFFALVVGVNLLALPFYFVPVAGQALYLAINGYLVGREYYDVVAARRLEPAAAAEFRKRIGGPVFAAGIVAALLLALPVVNLVAPLIAAAAMTHVFHGGRLASRAGA